MDKFSVMLTKRANLFAGGLAQLPPGITLIPERWAAVDIGGMATATIRATGTLEDLAHLLTWVGDRAEIRNDLGTGVWWGVIYEVEADLGGVTVNLSLESIVNRVAVQYASYLPDGSTESRTTDWVQDATSIDRYGKRELLYSLPEGYAEAAEVVRDRLLARLADPAPVLKTRSDYAVGATLYCRGVWDLLDFSYYTNDLGLAAHEDSAGQLYLGASYTANTISFAAADDIYDSNNGLSALQQGVVFTMAGAAQAANNGTFTVQSYDNAGHIETVENTQVTEAAGATVTIALGDQPAISKLAMKFRNTASGTWNADKVALRMQRVGSPGDKVQVQLCADSGGNPGTVLDQVDDGGIAGSSVPTEMNWVEFPLNNTQPLALSTDYWLVVSRSGSASLTNYYIVSIDEAGDAANLATTLLANVSNVATTIDVRANTLTNGARIWLTKGGQYEIMTVTSTATAITGGYRYSVTRNVDGSGANAWATNDAVYDAFGGLRIYTGSWGAHTPDADLPYRVIGGAYSTTQLRQCLETSTELSDVLVNVTSNIKVRTYRDSERSVRDEALDMLELGTSAGDRLIVTVTRDRVALVDKPPASSPLNPILGRDGRLRHPTGVLWEPGQLVCGRWVNVDGLPVLDGVATKTKGSQALYIERAEYDATNDTLILQSEGALDPWQAMRWKRG